MRWVDGLSRAWKPLLLMALLVATLGALGPRAASADGYPNSCLAVKNLRSQAIVVHVVIPSVPAPGDWTFEPGEAAWLMLDNARNIHVQNPTGDFRVSVTENGTSLLPPGHTAGDTNVNTWYYDASKTDDGVCNGTWIITYHD